MPHPVLGGSEGNMSITRRALPFEYLRQFQLPPYAYVHGHVATLLNSGTLHKSVMVLLHVIEQLYATRNICRAECLLIIK